MVETQTADGGNERERVSATDVSEGDRVFMGVSFHGSADDVDGAEYDRDLYQAGVAGTVVESLSDTEKELLSEGGRPMADLTVETDDGERFTWNVDNGYVLGYHPSLERRTDVGKIAGFYQ